MFFLTRKKKIKTNTLTIKLKSARTGKREGSGRKMRRNNERKRAVGRVAEKARSGSPKRQTKYSKPSNLIEEKRDQNRIENKDIITNVKGVYRL